MKKRAKNRQATYSGDQEDADKDVGDLTPENPVPFHSSITFQLVVTIGLESVGSLFGGETFESGGGEVLFGLFDSKRVEGRLWIEVDSGSFLAHNLGGVG
jgi:hypothetical protein